MVCSLFTACKNNKKQVPLSNLINWKNEEILKSGYPQWGASLVQNNTYVFYANPNREIIRIDKRSCKKTIIKKLDKLHNYPYLRIGMILSNKTLYYVYDSCLYQCDFNGDNGKQVVSRKQLKDFTKHTNIQDTVDGVRIYNNDLYLIIGCDLLVRFDPDTKKFQTVAEEVNSGEFYKDHLYYINGDTAIYKVNLKTFKRKLVRGKKWSKRMLKSKDTVYYQTFLKIKDQLYYTCSQGKLAADGAEPSKIYLYSENGKDIKKYNARVDLHRVVSDGTKIAYHYKNDKDYLIIYDMDTKKERREELPKDIYDVEQLVDDILLYRSDKELAYSIIQIQ